MERYQRIYINDNRLYIPEAGIIICAQAILKDNKTNNLVAQVKFQNILEKEVVALVISVECYDITNNQLEGVKNYQYLDLNINRDIYFGSKSAIILPDNNTRKISVHVQKLVYNDGTIWENDKVDFISLPKLECISNDKEIAKQAQLEFGNNAKYKYQKLEKLWICSCGAINHDSEKRCHSCRLSEVKLIETSLPILVEKKNQRLAEEAVAAQEAQEAQAILDKERKERNKKIALVLICISLIVLIISTIIMTKPARTIAKAEKFVENGEYGLALETLKNLKQPDKTEDVYEKISALFEDEISNALDKGEVSRAIDLLESYPDFESYDTLYASIRSVCPHEETKTDSKEAACVEDGYNNIICELCGFVDGVVYEALGHDFAVNVTKDATCTEDGNGHMVCKRCNYEEDQVLPKLGHDYEKKEIVAPSCDKKGKRECTCKVCGHRYTEEISATGHNWSAATCTKDGVCSTCGNLKETAYGHTWIEDSRNDRGLICKNCDANYPVSATLKTYGFPYSNDDIYIESMRIVNVKAYEEDEAFFVCTISGYMYDWVGECWVEVVDQNGNPVLDEWGLSRTSTVHITSGEGNFTSWEFYVKTPISGTYYIKIKYVM